MQANAASAAGLPSQLQRSHRQIACLPWGGQADNCTQLGWAGNYSGFVGAKTRVLWMLNPEPKSSTSVRASPSTKLVGACPGNRAAPSAPAPTLGPHGPSWTTALLRFCAAVDHAGRAPANGLQQACTPARPTTGMDPARPATGMDPPKASPLVFTATQPGVLSQNAASCAHEGLPPVLFPASASRAMLLPMDSRPCTNR